MDNLVRVAIDNEVAFVVVAGDLYDGNWKTISTGRYMATALGRLKAHGIEVFILQGNHDAASVLTRDLPLQAGIERFPSQKPGSFQIDELGVALHGQACHRHVPHDMTPAYPAPIPGYFNIGVLHTSLSSHGQHETYAPTTPETLRAKGYDYWALGHVHERMILQEGAPIVFPGVLQGRHIRETGEKGVILVSVTDHRIETITPIPCDVVRWHEERFDCTGLELDSAFQDQLGATFRSIAETHEGHLCVTRLILYGETALHERLRRQGPALRETLHHLAAMSGGEIELEKLVLETSPLAAIATPAMSEEEPFALAGLVRDAVKDDTLLNEIGKDLDLCLKTLNLGDIAPDSLLARIDRRDWASFLPELSEALCDRLTGKGDAS
nr:DNA repair exonuclease [Asaia astilbis]